ncbi:MAG TPA: lysylphosphatidylglycerol synthase domain-containing protein [Candidatus Nanoarchaeia archaeon]|nr:lysylphosphatidylglycerol synthase domain-containing protein [Candidatus Nanoarchaeia archaeon]
MKTFSRGSSGGSVSKPRLRHRIASHPHVIKARNLVLPRVKFVMMFVGLMILALLFRRVGFSSFAEIISEMSVPMMILASVAWLFTLFLSAYRLKRIVRSEILSGEMFRIFLYGYLLNYASPIQGLGAGAKVGMLKKRNVSISRSSASVSSELLYDLLFAALISAIFFITHIDFIISAILPLMSAVTAAIAGAIILFAGFTLYRLRRNEDIISFFSHLFSNFSMKAFFRLLPLTMLLWLFPAFMIYAFFLGIGQPLSLWIALSAICFSFLLGLFTLIPGGLGVRDAITAYIYSLAGIPIDTAISIALFNRAFTIGIVGLIILFLKLHSFILSRKGAEYPGEYPAQSKYFPYEEFRRYFKGRILELGSADGNNTLFLKKKYGLDKIFSLEYSFSRALRSKIKNDKAGGRDRDTAASLLVNADGRRLPFKDSSFDLVYCSEVIEHLPSAKDHAFLAEEIKRVLRPGRHCIITTPNHYLYRMFCFLTLTPPEPTHMSELTLSEFKSLLITRFKNVELVGVFGLFRPLMKLSAFRRLHSSLSSHPSICKALIAVCRK